MSMKCFTVGDPDLEVDTTQVHVCEAGYSHIIGYEPGPSHLITVHEAGPSHTTSYEACLHMHFPARFGANDLMPASN